MYINTISEQPSFFLIFFFFLPDLHVRSIFMKLHAGVFKWWNVFDLKIFGLFSYDKRSWP